MRPRSVRSTTPSGPKKSRASYGETSTHPQKEKSQHSSREVAESSERSARAPSESDPVPPEKISQRAYLIWRREGCPEGRDEEFWLRAEAELKKEHPG